MATAQGVPPSVISSQGANHHGTRKRKQNNLLSGAPGSGTQKSGSQDHQLSRDMFEKDMDKRLTAVIQSTVYILNFTYEFVLKCAMDLTNSGKLVTTEVLFEECESRQTSESSCVSDCVNAFPVSSTESTETSLASAHHSPASALLSSQSSVLPLSAHQLYSHSTKSTPNSESVDDPAYENAVSSLPNLSLSLDNYLSASGGQNSVPEDVEEDCVDGFQSSSVSDVCDDGLEGWPFSSLPAAEIAFPNKYMELNNVSSLSSPEGAVSAEHNTSFNRFSFDMPSVASLTTSQPIANMHENSVSNSASSGSSKQQSTKSQIIGNTNKASTPVKTQRTSRSWLDVVWGGADVNGEIGKDANLENTEIKKQAHLGSENRSKLRSPVERAEFLNICFKLVEKEHALLENSRLCSSCSLRPRDITFLPCGHFVNCRNCAEPVFVCPSCNNNVLATVDTYLS